ncbi:uncharacterized protein EDB91DRAFT_1086015 [Suillus paluster]|uniref:uncharacterized protein n=1 Tax=Suillus paluster TaxID=48578 RepID=UPI001B85D2F0|nr:uncharacterized protein EDB91DRAFT_1086015 [Suillus paluster]KAG1728601.1 hypothetical protein EDB91DRAFT_1086015 [Suillus paluster]
MTAGDGHQWTATFPEPCMPFSEVRHALCCEFEHPRILSEQHGSSAAHRGKCWLVDPASGGTVIASVKSPIVPLVCAVRIQPLVKYTPLTLSLHAIDRKTGHYCTIDDLFQHQQGISGMGAKKLGSYHGFQRSRPRLASAVVKDHAMISSDVPAWHQALGQPKTGLNKPSWETLAGLTASMPVSATPAVVGRDSQCIGFRKPCDISINDNGCCAGHYCYVHYQQLPIEKGLQDPKELACHERKYDILIRLTEVLQLQWSKSLEAKKSKTASQSCQIGRSEGASSTLGNLVRIYDPIDIVNGPTLLQSPTPHAGAFVRIYYPNGQRLE